MAGLGGEMYEPVHCSLLAGGRLGDGRAVRLWMVG
jgi:hypothetical protein